MLLLYNYITVEYDVWQDHVEILTIKYAFLMIFIFIQPASRELYLDVTSLVIKLASLATGKRDILYHKYDSLHGNVLFYGVLTKCSLAEREIQHVSVKIIMMRIMMAFISRKSCLYIQRM